MTGSAKQSGKPQEAETELLARNSGSSAPARTRRPTSRSTLATRSSRWRSFPAMIRQIRGT